MCQRICSILFSPIESESEVVFLNFKDYGPADKTAIGISLSRGRADLGLLFARTALPDLLIIPRIFHVLRLLLRLQLH